jgi:ATP-dependent DNA ligase
MRFQPDRANTGLSCLDAVGFQHLGNHREFAVVGYTPPKGSRTGFGSLLLARPKGRGWEYAGRVGTGFSGELIRSRKKHLAGGGPEPTVAGEIDRASTRGATWFEPRFVAEVFIRGYANSVVLRQSSLRRCARTRIRAICAPVIALA